MGAVGSPVQQMRDELLGMVAHFHAVVDFPDEDIDPAVSYTHLAEYQPADPIQNGSSCGPRAC